MAIGKPSETKLKLHLSRHVGMEAGLFLWAALLRQGYAGLDGARMATFAQQMAEKYRALLADSAGLKG